MNYVKPNSAAKVRKRIYLSLPISGYDLEERRETAMQTEVRLHSLGYDVVSPLGSNWEAGLTTQEYMQRDLEMLLTCDAIYLMTGWNRSAGCHCELCVATACGKEVLFEDMECIVFKE